MIFRPQVLRAPPKPRVAFFPRALARPVPQGRLRLASPAPIALRRAYKNLPPRSKALYFPVARTRWAPVVFRVAGSTPVALRNAYKNLPPKSKELFFPRARVRWAPAYSPEEIEPRVTTFNIFVLKLEVADGSGNDLTQWFSTKAMITGATSRPSQTTFRELVKEPGSIKRQVFGNGRSAGLVSPTWGQIEFVNTGGAFDGWLEYATDGGKVTCYYGPYDGVFPGEFRKAYIAYIDGSPNIDNKTARFAIRGREKLFERKVVTAGFTNASGFENGVDLELTGIPGSRLPFLVMGTPGYYQPILTNDLENIWQIAANASMVGVLPRIFDGGVELIYAGGIAPGGVGGGGTFGLLSRPTGPVYVQLVTTPRFEVRAYMTGYYATATVTAKRWDIVDLAKTAGIGGVDASNMPSGSTVYDAGNRRVEAQSFKDVFNDIAAFQVASIGLNRLDRFYARAIVPSYETTSIHTFRDGGSRSDGNSRGWAWAPIPGLEKRAWQLRVKSGETSRSALAGIVADDIRDALSRDPWTRQFVADVTFNSGAPYYQASTVLDSDPTAEIAEVEIVSHEFTSTALMEAFALRYMKVYGSKSVAMWLEAEFNRDTLQLELLDPVALVSDRYGTRTAVIWAIDTNLKTRKIRFGCWSHRASDAPTAGTISITQSDSAEGAGGGGAGTGAAGKKDAAPQIEQLPIDCSDKTTALTVSTLVQAYIVPYDFYLTGVGAALYAQQTSGSTFTLDMRATAVSFLSTLITIDNNEYSSFTAVTQPVVSSQVLLKGTRVTFHITQLGTGAKGLTGYLIGYQL